MKGIIIVSLILLAGLASAYTPEQQTALDGMNLSFQLGIAYEKALQGQNVAEYNTLVDEYNAWLQLHFGENTSLLKSKINETAIVITPSADETHLIKQPFNASSDLSKFGKQQVYAVVDGTTQANEDYISPKELGNF
jgi:hypothetical protein